MRLKGEGCFFNQRIGQLAAPRVGPVAAIIRRGIGGIIFRQKCEISAVANFTFQLITISHSLAARRSDLSFRGVGNGLGMRGIIWITRPLIDHTIRDGKKIHGSMLRVLGDMGLVIVPELTPRADELGVHRAIEIHAYDGPIANGLKFLMQRTALLP